MSVEDAAAEISGPLLRQARLGCHMTLQDVSDSIGISVTHLSRLESSKRQPSVGILMQLARLYGTSVGDLLGENTSTRHHLTRADVRTSRPGPDGPFTVLTGLPDLRGLHAVELTLAGIEHHPSSHEDEEILYTLAGAVSLSLGDETIELREGDAIHFDARVEHSLTDLQPNSRVVIVCAPLPANSFRPHALPRRRS
ncbi:MAG: XRE family transcriptional regulator [Nocardioidaceae bacterium]|nr:XRE family transcriptional regulator [Nocardioidaceae bacterium]